MRPSPEADLTAAARLRVLHVNDAAFTTIVLMGEARRRRLPWRYLPLATLPPISHPAARGVLRAVTVALRERARHDVVLVHDPESASRRTSPR
ncbi:MAG: hypothetical protein Q4F67_11240 [Propionibacteriaceae bacterium]|nr:hypothetical protein [Propionibacteriaceae bacterium]